LALEGPPWDKEAAVTNVSKFNQPLEERMHCQSRWLASVLLIGPLALSIYAKDDGVVLIDQKDTLAGNVTPGDTPGFPVSITQPGSYKLSGNLTVPNNSTSGIVISADHVTIDLGGFAILGPVNCPGGSCTGGGSSIAGIRVNDFTKGQFNITIRNGTIQGIGGWGIALTGGGFLIEQMHVTSTHRDGIFIDGIGGAGVAIVRSNTCERNEGGIIVLSSGIVEGNIVRGNRLFGIHVLEGRVINNVVGSNSHAGILLGFASYSGNVVQNNIGGPPAVSGGFNMGQNLCGNVACPGAVN
jgi:hypothetical protein